MVKYTFATEAEMHARVDYLFDQLSNRPDMPEDERDAIEAEYAVLTDDPEYFAHLPPGSSPTFEILERPLRINPRSVEPPPAEPVATSKVAGWRDTTLGCAVMLLISPVLLAVGLLAMSLFAVAMMWGGTCLGFFGAYLIHQSFKSHRWNLYKTKSFWFGVSICFVATLATVYLLRWYMNAPDAE